MSAARTGGAQLFRLLIGGLILVSAAAQFALVPVMPLYTRQLGLSGFEQGLVLGATGLAALAVSVPAGTLSDRFGPRRITLAAGLLMAAATAAQALAGNFPALFASRLVFGAGYGMVWTAGLVWLAGAATGGPPALGASVTSSGVGGVGRPRGIWCPCTALRAGGSPAGHRGGIRPYHRRAGRAAGCARASRAPRGCTASPAGTHRRLRPGRGGRRCGDRRAEYRCLRLARPGAAARRWGLGRADRAGVRGLWHLVRRGKRPDRGGAGVRSAWR